MYTILINQDNSLTKTNPDNIRIMHRSNMVDKIHFLCEPNYGEYDMRDFTVALEYVSPISRTYRTEFLTAQTELYKDRIEYILPIDTKLTAEHGDVEIKFTFTQADMLEDGTRVNRVRHTDATKITIIPVEAWSDQINSADLSTLAEIMLANQSMMEQVKALANQFNATKADDLVLDADANKLVLKSENKVLREIDLKDLGDEIVDAAEDGLVEMII